jgi:leucyl aminopeptidase
MVIANKLRLFLSFMDELKQVKVDAETNRVESRIAIMGVVRGERELENLFEVAGIDYYLTSFVDVVNNICSMTAHEMSPKQIVGGLAKAFQKDHDLQMKILDGKTLTDEEMSFTPPKSFDVFSSTVSTDEGLKRVQEWFKAKVAAKGKTAP